MIGVADLEVIQTDIAVIGGGPAGLAAAVTARQLGPRVVNIDEGARSGGQIWRHASTTTRPAAAGSWIDRLRESGALVLSGSSVVAATRRDDGVFELLVERAHGCAVVQATSVVLATGARELFLPFPGWTLPGVVGIGGLQALAKSGLDVADRRIALAGSGPLMLPVAALLAAKGARLSLVAEQAPLGRIARFTLSLVRSPSTVFDAARYRLAFAGVPYRTGTWVLRADGDDRVQEATLTDGRRTWTVACDYLGAGFGLIPNLEVSRLLECESTGGAVRVDQQQHTSVSRVFAAGEAVGVAGVDVAVAEGIIAGHAAAGALAGASTSQARRVRDRGRAQARRMHRAFALRDELRSIATQDCIICRCEDIPLSAIPLEWSARQAKLYGRVGMGPCQGRICGAAMGFLRGWDPGSVRAPLQPSSLSTLAAGREGTTPPPTTGAPTAGPT